MLKRVIVTTLVTCNDEHSIGHTKQTRRCGFRQVSQIQHKKLRHDRYARSNLQIILLALRSRLTPDKTALISI